MVATVDDGNAHVAHDCPPGRPRAPVMLGLYLEHELTAEFIFARLVAFFVLGYSPSRKVFVLGQDLGFEDGVFVVG